MRAGMTRSLLGSWVADTEPEERSAAAIAAIGVLAGNFFRSDLRSLEAGDLKSLNEVESLTDCLRRLLKDASSGDRLYPRRLRWGCGEAFSPKWQLLLNGIGPGVAAAAWRSFVHREGSQSLQCPARDFSDEDVAIIFPWLRYLPAWPNIGIDSIYFEWWRAPIGAAAFSSTTRWSWPLNIGFLSDDRSQTLMHEVGAFPEKIRRLIRIIDLERTGQPCDLLVSPWDVSDTLRRLPSRKVSASAILLSENPNAFNGKMPSLVSKLRNKVGASAVSLIGDWERFNTIFHTVVNVSHDMPFDEAVASLDGFSLSHIRLTIADAAFIEATRISRLGRAWADRLSEQGRYAEAAEATRLAKSMFDHESGAASELAEQSDRRLDFAEVRKLKLDAWQVPPPKRRWIKRGIRGFFNGERSAWHFIRVHIAKGEKEGDPNSVRFADERVDWKVGKISLKIGIVAPSCDVLGLASDREFSPALIDNLVQSLTIPFFRGSRFCRPVDSLLLDISLSSSGPSTNAFFLVNAPPSAKARILVADGNRILQTAILDIQDITGVEKATTPVVSFQEEGIVRATLEGLRDRRPFDMALLTNDSLTGFPQVTTLADDRIKLDDMDEIKPALAAIKPILEDVVNLPDDFTEPESEALTTLLNNLAQQGVILRRYFNDRNLGTVLDRSPERIQIVSANPDEALPIEFIYEGYAPDDGVSVCPNQRDRLDTGSCGSCRHRSGSEHVCALRFWGISKVIERHVYDRRAPERGNFVTMTEPTGRNRIEQPTIRMFASSIRARQFTGAQQLFATLSPRLAPTLPKSQSVLLFPSDWNDWRHYVDVHRPTLLVLVAHTDLLNNREVLEIGSGECLTNAQIDERIVGDNHPTIVLLLGCETANSDLRMASFVTAFRHAKAAVVIATLTSVLGRHAAPIAVELIEKMDEYWRDPRPITVGDAIADLRRCLLKKGLPAGLMITAFGDADWIIGGADVAS
ncbi:hypothetical protein NLM16_09015 [Bradyrhizobium brasilense]|uniref:hypothetical protein n=1 Tax=Bradyrhizobium brasilense TaxID=1419277 RepID=UPI0028772927|nr:hypothetical protein [Bradyrhizobium brasilense]MCP3414239.1 hypothetical protein [Bradyrhizobium brasilense]